MDANEEPPPVKIVRVAGTAYKRSSMARAASYSLFLLGSLWHQLIGPRFDVVLTMTTPPLLCVGGTIVKALRGTRHYIWEMDLFPDALIALGALKEHGWFVRLVGALSDYCRRKSDGIIALGPCMRRRLLARGIPKRLIRVVENWADGRVIHPRPYRRRATLHVLYSGNLGLSHDVDTILAAIRSLQSDSRFLFTFAGGGVNRDRLQQICQAEKLRNVNFIPYTARTQMSDHFATADVGLVTELPRCIGTVVPSKVYGLMAAGKPVLFVGPRCATPALLIRRFQCGWCVEPGDSGGLIDLLLRLYEDHGEVRLRGLQAREVFVEHYDLSKGVARIAQILGVSSSWKGALSQPDEELAPATSSTH
jgi:glycosyltransferase involved in cell wall biosynthesis